MKTHVFRLKRKMDLKQSIEEYVVKHNIQAATILSGVGCLYKACIRDASGVHVRKIEQDVEIVSLNGTLWQNGCHLHMAFSNESLETMGGHLMYGCLVNTTCEVVLLELEDVIFSRENDDDTGYDELVVRKVK